MFKKLMGLFLSTALVSTLIVGLTMPTQAYADDANIQTLSAAQGDTYAFFVAQSPNSIPNVTVLKI